MRREIRFRAWHTGKKIMFSAEEMAADQLTLLPTGQFINVSSVRPSMSTIYPADKLIPLQFTGLKDRNGREIYEGDIVRGMVKDYDAEPDKEWNYPLKEVMRDVVTMERFPGYWLQHESFGYEGEELIASDEVEVIGNIHENPELLEGR